MEMSLIMSANNDPDKPGPPEPIDDQGMFKPLEWVCKHCGHHQGLNADQPDKCENCGMSGASATV